MILPVEIQGIPCQVRVTHYRRALAPILTGPMDWADPGAPAEIEFEVLDEHRRRDRALESQMDDADTRAVEQEAIAAMEEQIQADRDRAAEDRAEDRRIFGVIA